MTLILSICVLSIHTCPVLWGSNSPEKGCLTMKDNENHPSLRCCWNLFRMACKYICSPTTEGRDGQLYVSKRSRLHVAVHSPFHALCGKDDPLRCAVIRVSPVSGLSCVDNQYNTIKTMLARLVSGVLALSHGISPRRHARAQLL